MDLNKALKIMEIEPIRRLDFIEANQIMTNFVDCLLYTFPKLQLNRSALLTKMFDCTMYLANFPENLGSANYIYQNKSIYYRGDTDISILDDYMVHELIHYFQDTRDKHGKLEQMGLCYFLEFKIHGMAMNEAAVQYVTSRMLEHYEEEIEYAGITAKTISKDYYPLLCNLIMQMVYLVGEDSLIDSTLFSTDKFLYSFMDIVGETSTKEIQAGFDELLEAKQNMKTEAIKAIYEKVQNKIFTSYFEQIHLIETIEEAEEYKDKLEGYRDVMGNLDNYAFYNEYTEKALEKLDKKIISISRKNSKNMLTVISNNKIFAIFRLIRNFFRTKVKDV